MPLWDLAFNHSLSALVSNISTEKYQARVWVLDCSSDPLGWKDRILKSGRDEKDSLKGSVTVFKDVKDTTKLLSSILNLGKGFVGNGKARVAVVIDSGKWGCKATYKCMQVAKQPLNVNELTREKWMCHINEDLHEPGAFPALVNNSTMVASLEPTVQSTEGQKNTENLFWFEQHFHKGKFHVHLKRINGRVKLLHDEFHMEQGGIKFTAVSTDSVMVNQILLPKVQFNFQLSGKEKVDRAKVVLPFEHQGNGENIQTYDGRQSLPEGKKDPCLMQHSVLSTDINNDTSNGTGEIYYIRDSDDEAPDSNS